MLAFLLWLALPLGAGAQAPDDDDLAAAVDAARGLTGAECQEFVTRNLETAGQELERLQGLLAVLADKREKSGMLVPDDTLSVFGVVRGGPAHLAGIKAGDRIVSVGSQKASSLAELSALVARAANPLEVTVSRNGRELTFRFAKGPAPRVSDAQRDRFQAALDAVRAKIEALKAELVNKNAFACEPSKRGYIDGIGLPLTRLLSALDEQAAASLVPYGE